MDPRRLVAVLWTVSFALCLCRQAAAQTPVHPLDPLGRTEIEQVVAVINASGHARTDTRAAFITLAEPDKAAVLAWRAGMPSNRRALAVLRNGADVYEATVDLAAGTLVAWRNVPGAQPAIDAGEWAVAQALVKADGRWLAAMRERGYADVSDIFCEGLSVGYFGGEEPRRLLKMTCFDHAGGGTNPYARPIEGVTALVDLTAGLVVDVLDTGPVPVSTQLHDIEDGAGGAQTSSRREAGRPRSAAPRARSDGKRAFELTARMVRWGPWSFHLGFDARFGTVLSLVTFADGGRPRPVLYQGHLSEVFVPYMDADEGWYYRTYLDAGEYGLGVLSSSLRAGVDCPRDAAFVDVDLADAGGNPYVRARAVCVFERDRAAPAWRHVDAIGERHSGRRGRELIVRAIPSIANYDYIVDWVFTPEGEIRIDVGATGVDSVKGVAVEHMGEPGADAATRSGMLVAPNLVAVHHDHYFSFRLDLDVDGTKNTFVRERLRTLTLAKTHPRRSLWQLERMAHMTEGALSARTGPELWRIENAGVATALGHHPSFQIESLSRATSLLDANDWPQRRAAFSGETLWLTVYGPGELSAAGPYPNQSRGDDGLPSYVNGETLVDADIVAWVTVGFHHLTRPEDWPVLPTLWHSLRLRPYGFFTGNPSHGAGGSPPGGAPGNSGAVRQ